MGYLNIFLGAFLGDLLVKKTAEAKLPMGKRISILGGRIWLRKLHNRGAAGGFLSDQPDVLLKSTLGMLASVFGYAVMFLRNGGKKIEKVGAALLLAGGCCNWFDRVHQGYVTDYFSINCRKEEIRNLVFNLSDFFIFIGTLLMAVGSLLPGKRKK